MSNSDDGYNSDFSRDSVIAEVLLRITALENLLMDKGMITNKEIQDHLSSLSTKIASIVGANDIIMLPETSEEDNIADAEYKDFMKEFSLTTKKVSKDN